MPKPTPPEVLVAEAAVRAQQRLTEHIERFAAGYIKLTDIPANEAVLCSQMKDGVMRLWFERKTVDASNNFSDGPEVSNVR